MAALRFTEPQDLATFLGLPPFQGTDLTRATFLLELTENMVTEEVGQVLSPVVDDELVVKSAGGEVILLPELPVVEVTLVTELPAASEETPTELTAWTDYDLELGRRGRAGILRRVGRHWPARGEVRITYSHGFRTGHGDPDDLAEDWPYTLPGLVPAVVLQAAARGFSNPTEIRQETSGRWGGTYAEIGLFLTAQDKTALNPLRKGSG